jgi:RecA/RadA recombinase
MKKVFHTPITDVEQLKHDIMVQLAEVKRGDPLMIVIDSIGQLASLKEVEDAIEGKSVADMTRAKAIKSLFRMITPHLRIKDIPLIVINHTYKEIGMFPKDIVGGGTGSYFAADTIWIVGRQQEKVDGEVAGYNFVLNIEKSRQVKEKSKFPITVKFNFGIEAYSGLLENAIEAGFVDKPSPGWYIKKGSKTKVREADTKDLAFWKDILEDEAFNEFIRKKYQVAYGDILAAEPDSTTTEEGK